LLALVCLIGAGCGSGTSPAELPPVVLAPFSASAPIVAPSPSAKPVLAPSPTPRPPQSGWTTYLGVNDVQGVAFAPDGSLWAATTGGAAHWNLDAGTYTQYTTAGGLPSAYLTGVAQAPDGSLWFATLGGVARLAGSTWTRWTEADGLVANAVQAIAVTPAGQVWIGTTEGIGRFDGSGWTTYLPGTRAYKVAVAPDGSVWFAGHGAGAIRYSPAGDLWTAYTQAAGQPLAGVTALAVGPEGSVWVYENWQGVYRLAAPAASGSGGGPWQKVQDHMALVCSIAVAADGTPWIGTCGSMHSSFGNLLRGQGSGWQEIEGWHELGKPAIRSIAFGPGDALAVGTEKGLAVQQAGTWRTLRGGPGRNRVTAVAVTPDGAAWFGFGDDQFSAAGGGVSRFDGQMWQYFLGDANVRVLVVAPDAVLWAGTGCGVQRFDGAVWHEMAVCDDLGPGNVVDLAFGPGGEVWAATGMSLVRFDGQTWQDMGRMVSSIAAAPDGTLWASGWEGAQDSYYVAYYDGSAWAQALDRSLASLTVMPDGSVWAVDGGRGLVGFDGETWQPIAGVPASSACGALAVAPNGALWLNGQAGLARWDDGVWTTYPAVEGVQAMAIAVDGSVWLATANGIVRFEADQVRQ
jgi:ligand-binding sensor domain-containing protein